MRFLHTSDWHLGRLFHGVHLTDDQAHLLDQLVALAREARVDAVIVAGDVYDRAVPPPEAVRLLDEVLERLVREVGTRVVVVAGNHDSPERVEFGSRIFEEQGLLVAGNVTATARSARLADGAGDVVIHALPYAEPASVRGVFADETLRDHDVSLRRQLDAIRATTPAGARSVVIAHAFVVGGEESPSERPLSIGGAGTVGADAFGGFTYAALGHLHRPQEVGSGRVVYSGSLLKYSFDEADHAKSVALVEIGADGEIRSERVRLSPRRDVRRVSGTLRELLDGADVGPREDYLEVTILDQGGLFEPMTRLREVLPNVLSLRRVDVPAGRGSDRPARERSPRRDELELFSDFHADVANRVLEPGERDFLVRLLADLRRREREAPGAAESAGGEA